MQRLPAERIFRIVSHVVLALMVVSIVYAGLIAVWHWAGIGV